MDATPYPPLAKARLAMVGVAAYALPNHFSGAP